MCQPIPFWRKKCWSVSTTKFNLNLQLLTFKSFNQLSCHKVYTVSYFIVPYTKQGGAKAAHKMLEKFALIVQKIK
jgi:hypothetical protein